MRERLEMAAPTFTSKFAIDDKYKYLDGFGSYHQSEAIEGACPRVFNSPQKPPFDLLTERISGTSFTAPRHENLQTWMYRTTPSMHHSELVEHGGPAETATRYTPNSYIWPALPVDDQRDWTSGQKLLAMNGDPMAKRGLALWVFNVEESMAERSAFASLDGDALIILQSGALDVQTELGSLMVRQNEICVVPRAIRYRMVLPAGISHARGFVSELYQGHFQLPNLGIVGSTGLANVRDFQVPVARYDGKLEGDVAVTEEQEWNVLVRQAGRMWSYTQDSTPFDVAAWHGTYYPFKYDLARFCVLGNAAYDEHDPSLYVVLTAPAHGEPGTAVVDFAIIPPRWNVAENTLWLPYFHRNTMTEFFGPIIREPDPEFAFNQKGAWTPFGAGMSGPMATHGSMYAELEKARNAPTKPLKIGTEPFSIFLLETQMPLYLSDWADEMALKNTRAEDRSAWEKVGSGSKL